MVTAFRFVAGTILAVVLEVSCQSPVSAPVSAELNWSGTVTLTDDVTISAGQVLRIAAGSTVKALGNFRVVAVDGASIHVDGTEARPVRLLAGYGGIWGGLVVSGPGSLVVRHSDVAGAPLIAKNGARLIIEDSQLHDYYVDAPPIVYTYEARSARLDRVHIWNYYEANFVRTRSVVERSLFERMIGDGIDFDNSPAGTVVRACTVRNATKWNVDAIDFGVVFYPHERGSQGSVEDCLIYDITDKGVSVGERAEGVSISNTLIHHVGIGISAKDGSVVTASHVTLADNNYGINSYEERGGMGGGVLTASNMVILGNLVGTQILDGATLTLTDSAVDAEADLIDPSTNVAYLSSPEDQYSDRDLRRYELSPRSGLSGFGFAGTVGAPTSGPAATDFVPTPVKVAIYGNSRSGPTTHSKIVSLLALQESPDLVINTGDMVSGGTQTSGWSVFQSVVKPLLKIAPFYPVPGPEEELSGTYPDQFQLPTRLSGTEKWYAVKKEGSLFLQLDSTVLARPTTDSEYQAQMDWLEALLLSSTESTANIKFRFVTLNSPVYSVGTQAEPDPQVSLPHRDALVSILTDERWKVDMVFSGHHAFYEREKIAGVPWFILGGGGAPLDQPRQEMLNDQTMTVAKWHYALLEVGEGSAELRVLDLGGNQLDSWTVTK